MRLIRIVIFILFNTSLLLSQNILRIKVTAQESGEPLAGANIIIKGTALGASSNSEGIGEIINVPDGNYTVMVSYIGFEESSFKITLPLKEEVIEVELEHEAEELEEISVSSTRTSRLISNIPTRVEVIAGEEIDEKISMDPSGIQMILTESTGILVQQTSALSVNSTFRIQGLEGRYTQLLKNGFPLYSGFAGSLSLLQVPPLDLQQVEIVKGSSSTLFGGGAIAGLINPITKTPDPDGDISFLANVTSAGGLDLSGYYSRMYDELGLTLLVTRNTQRIYDNNDDNFSDLPETERYSVTPEFFYQPDKDNELRIGGSFITETRDGGYMPLDKNIYSEKNKSSRISGQVRYKRTMSEGNNLVIRNSTGYFKRELNLPAYQFSGSQFSTFTEVSYSSSGKKLDWIVGANIETESFIDLSIIPAKRDFSDLTAGIFTQWVYDISEIHSIEPGLRVDYAKDYDIYILPRISLMSKWDNHITTRAGGGPGYKLPSLFTEEAEEVYFRNVLPLVKTSLKAEKSLGFNFDINYSGVVMDMVAVSLNNMFFYTRINDPLMLNYNNSMNAFEFISNTGYYHTMGIETNLKLSLDHLKLFTGYTYTNVTSPESPKSEMPLTPKHRLGIVLIYEEHGNYRIGIEGYFTGEQLLTNGEKTRSFWVHGLMLEKHFRNFSIFLNFENIFDTRQSMYGSMYSGPVSNPVFAEIYAPTDGRIINGGIKLRL